MQYFGERRKCYRGIGGRRTEMNDSCVFSAETTSAIGIAKEGNRFASTGEDDRVIGGEKLTRGFGRVGDFVRRKYSSSAILRRGKCRGENATAGGAHDPFRRLHTGGAECTPTQY
jgi:hypothetical protein